MHYYAFGISDVGNYRDNNEDAFLLDKVVMTQSFLEKEFDAPFLAAVCDGVAGEKSGEIAAKLALEKLGEINYTSSLDISQEIIKIHDAIKAYGNEHAESLNMQTTMCCLAVDELDYAYCINIGDSRLYRCSDGVVTQISTDHSLVQYLYNTGKITNEEKQNHKNRNIIFPVLGNVETVPIPEITPLKMKISGDDIILICSDGLSDYITSEEIEVGISLQLSLKERIETLIELALERGSTDNITIIAVCAVSDNNDR